MMWYSHPNWSIVSMVRVMRSRKDPTATRNFRASSASKQLQREHEKLGWTDIKIQSCTHTFTNYMYTRLHIHTHTCTHAHTTYIHACSHTPKSHACTHQRYPAHAVNMLPSTFSSLVTWLLRGSLSTLMVLKAMTAKRSFGKGISKVLQGVTGGGEWGLSKRLNCALDWEILGCQQKTYKTPVYYNWYSMYLEIRPDI